MGDIIVVLAAVFGALLVIAGLAWLIPRLRRRLAGTRNGLVAGPLPSVGFIAAGLLVITIAIGGFSAGSDDGNVPAWCELGNRINEQIDLEEPVAAKTFEGFVDAAPEEIREASVTAAEGFRDAPQTASEDDQVQSAVEEVEAFHERECG
jgi:hypothetical protein